MTFALLCATMLLRGQDTFQHTFIYVADKDLKSVSVAGTFNNWTAGANPMSSSGRTWSVTLALPKGRIQYKFVLDGKDWIQDPKAEASFDDGNGNINSVLMVLPDDYKVAAKAGDGVISASALAHKQVPPYFSFDRGHLNLGVQVRTGDVDSVSVTLNGKNYPMSLHSSDTYVALYRTTAPWDGKTDLSYSFNLKDGDVTKTYGPNGLTDGGSNSFTVKASEFHNILVPNWPEHSVIYQIFPDRFDNGDRSNDPADVVPWNSKPTYDNHFGGDFAGVAKHIGYLENLGVKAVYFNPIFVSRDNHRYATGDYMHVDPELGTDAEFSKLTHKLKQRGIGTILDGVFNHTATYFSAFQDVVKNGAASKYKDWYFIKSFPVITNGPPNYEAWFGFGSMPKLNPHNPATREYLLNVPRHWDSVADIAGWRLDVPNELPSDYWVDFRKVVKSTNPNRWIIGEIWGDGSPWLQGDQFDSIMGYQFRTSALAFLATETIGPKEFTDRLMATYDSYAPQVARNLMSLLGSHDTERFLTLCHEDQNLAKLGATIQLTWPGAPSIYYGDELGMTGGKDPMNRKSMNWAGIEENQMLVHYRKLIRARNSSIALQSGDPVILMADDSHETLAFARVLSDEVGITAVNRSKHEQTLLLPLDGKVPLSANLRKHGFMNVLDGAKASLSPAGSIVLTLPAESSAVLLPAGTPTTLARTRPNSKVVRPVLKSAS